MLKFNADSDVDASTNIKCEQALSAYLKFLLDMNIGICHLQDAIMRLMYYEFGFSALILLIIIIYFPTRPPKPPSISASIERLDYK